MSGCSLSSRSWLSTDEVSAWHSLLFERRELERFPASCSVPVLPPTLTHSVTVSAVVSHANTQASVQALACRAGWARRQAALRTPPHSPPPAPRTAPGVPLLRSEVLSGEICRVSHLMWPLALGQGVPHSHGPGAATDPL